MCVARSVTVPNEAGDGSQGGSGRHADAPADTRRAGARHVATLTLGPLSRGDTIGLVQALSRPGSDEAAVIRLSEQMWRTSGGNPFVVIEAMRAATQETLSPGLERLSLPERVRDIISGQLDRLGERSRELVALASVVGREFEFGLLHHASGLGEEEARGEWKS
jgi:predicted ATPase